MAKDDGLNKIRKSEPRMGSISIRINASDRRKFDEAAQLRGVSTAEIVRQGALNYADRVIRYHSNK